MNEGKTFLDELQDTIKRLQNDGIITAEQIEAGLDVPIEWFFSKGIDRRILSKTMDNICRKVNPAYQKASKKSYDINTIKIIEKNGETFFQISGRDNWTVFNIASQSFHQKAKIETFDEKEFIRELQTTMRESKEYKLQNRLENLSDKQIQEVLRIMYDQRQQINEEKGLGLSLAEMIENFGEYYRYLYNEKEQAEKQDMEITSGGLIEQDVDTIPFTRSGSGSHRERNERVNEIYPFNDRDNIFRQLNPMQIISFDSVDEDKHVQRGTYTSYVYRNKRENGGYFIVAEPYRGDKACRVVYLTDEYVKSLQEGEEDSKFWVNISRTYLEMSGQEFNDEKSTYTMKHRALDTYAAKLQYIISGEKNPNVSNRVIYSGKIILSKLFGVEMNKQSLGEIASDTSREEIDAARRIILTERQEISQGGRAE